MRWQCCPSDAETHQWRAGAQGPVIDIERGGCKKLEVRGRKDKTRQDSHTVLIILIYFLSNNNNNHHLPRLLTK